MPRLFLAVLINTLVAAVTNHFIWFAVTFWVYLETRSVIVTSVMAGIFTVTVAGSGFLLGSVVDRYSKKTSMLLSSAASFGLYTLATVLFLATPPERFTDPGSVQLWLFIVLTLMGVIAGNLRGIALSTLVPILVPEGKRSNANGLVGTVTGTSYLFASIFGGLVIGFLGALWMLAIALSLTVLAALHLLTLKLPGRTVLTAAEHADTQRLDLTGTIRQVTLIPGLIGLIFFQTFNNFLGGIFISLLDAYGLSLVSVQVWGILTGVLSTAFIVGGLIVARRGLGPNPLRSLFFVNCIMWTIAIFFTIQESIVLLTIGMFVWMSLTPVAEAAEQTILQTVVPHERQGRVFGFAQSVEQAASPITSFLIGPIAQLLFIPFMSTGAGVELIGGWFGTGTARGIALLFSVSGAIGLAVTLLAMRTGAYRSLSAHYRRHRFAEPVPA